MTSRRIDGRSTRHAYARLERATAGLEAPFALVDLDALGANAADMERRAARQADPAREQVGALPRAAGARARPRRASAARSPSRCPRRCGSPGTASRTSSSPTRPPIAPRCARSLAAERPRHAVTVMVDGVEQLELIERAARRRASAAPVRVCIDVDAGWRAARRPRARRRQALARAHPRAGRRARPRDRSPASGLRLVGIMAYEAQIAGSATRRPGKPAARRCAIRAMQARSARELAARRAAVVAPSKACRAPARRRWSSSTAAAPAASQRTRARARASPRSPAGSGLYGPTLFDAYRAFTPRPAALFALPVVRRPGPGRRDGARRRLPRLRPGRRGAAAACRTSRRACASTARRAPARCRRRCSAPPPTALAIGDRVYLRHAKAGELCERFASLHLLEGERIVEEVPTYRGEGQCFL